MNFNDFKALLMANGPGKMMILYFDVASAKIFAEDEFDIDRDLDPETETIHFVIHDINAKPLHVYRPVSDIQGVVFTMNNIPIYHYDKLYIR